MSFKPKKTVWFETYTPRELTVYAIEALVQTGQVELTHDILSNKIRDADFIRSQIKESDRLTQRFSDDLPASLLPPEMHKEEPEHLADTCLKFLRKWCADLLKLKREIKKIRNKIENLENLRELINSIPDHNLDFSRLEHHSDVLFKKIYCCPTGQFQHPSGLNLYVDVYPGEKHDFILAFGTPEHAATIEAAAILTNCREIELPDYFQSITPGYLDEIKGKILDLEENIADIKSKLDLHKQDKKLKKILATLRLLKWYLDNTSESVNDHTLCHLIGWTSAESPQFLEKSLNEAGIEAKVNFAENPENHAPPVQRTYSWWTQPFSYFVNLAGIPGSDEIDPTPLLALVVPLLFGYMFPDVGHGLVLVLFGLVISKKIPEALLLIPCGIAAMFFGIIFGDVFGQHDILNAIWVKPLENPLLVILVPLVLGAVLIITGLLFSAIEAHWRGEFIKWLQIEASVFVLYLVLVFSIFNIDILWLLPPIILWYTVGTILGCQIKKPSCLLKALAHLIDSAIRLVINSISFVRVGAFALAHSAVSHAVNQIAGMIDNVVMFVVFFALSHLFIIALEGLIVFVQTSRLILFEFFVRFLKAEGRIFKPMQKLI